MQITAQDICLLVDGKLEGDPSILIHGPSKIEEGKPGTISFLANPKYEAYAYTTAASVLLVSNEFQAKQNINATLIRVKDVYAGIAFLLEKFGQIDQPIKGISDQAFLHESITLGENVSIGAFAVIEEGVKIGDNTTIYSQVYIGRGVEVGNNCVLYPGTKIYRDCKIGEKCILHANVVIGSDGFGFAPQEDGSYKKIAQTGNVILEDEVEIGANTVIDRATMGSTILKKGVKLDNLIQVAHNVVIGQNTVIAAQAGIAGSTRIGENCMIGGQAGFVGHIEIANGTKVQAQSGINRTIKKEHSAVYGSPALPYNDYLRAYAIFKNLPQLYRKIHDLEQKIKELES